MRNTLARSESLKSHKLIRLLFESGKSAFSYPFKMVYQEIETEDKTPVLYMISVSKRKIKTAVGRNHIKRLFREAYRKNKHPLFEKMESNNKKWALAFIYVGEKDMEYAHMEEKVKNALQLLISKLTNKK
jgi:ribonuclease P protein component